MSFVLEDVVWGKVANLLLVVCARCGARRWVPVIRWQVRCACGNEAHIDSVRLQPIGRAAARP